MDEFIDELLREDRACDVILPRIQVTLTLTHCPELQVLLAFIIQWNLNVKDGPIGLLLILETSLHDCITNFMWKTTKVFVIIGFNVYLINVNPNITNIILLIIIKLLV